MKLKSLIELAERHAKSAEANWRVDDAKEQKASGDFEAARRSALLSLEASVGKEHIDYRKAAASNGERA